MRDLWLYLIPWLLATPRTVVALGHPCTYRDSVHIKTGVDDLGNALVS